MTSKEIAKFLCGATSWEAAVHVMLAFSGLLPLTVPGFVTLTPTLNIAAIILWAVVALLLGYYAWGRTAQP